MANEEQIKILKQGVISWNHWRADNPDTLVDLYQADLNGIKINGGHLWKVNLQGASLMDADLWDTNLTESNLTKTNFARADLTGVRLNHSNLTSANLDKANLTITWVDGTTFANIDLNNTKGLEQVKHFGASIIDNKTLRLSKGKIPIEFLRGCGLSDWEIESAKLYNPDLKNEEIVKIQYRIYDLRATQAIQISPLFISYSHTDSAFVDKLEKRLNEKGVRFWRDIHELTAGRMETQIDRAIRQNPTVLLILSKNSMNSDWVQHEVRKARDFEKEFGRDILCPIALDDGWKSSRWPQRVMEQVMEYNILDFSKWEDEANFQVMFAKLLSGLDLFYKKPE